MATIRWIRGRAYADVTVAGRRTTRALGTTDPEEARRRLAALGATSPSDPLALQALYDGFMARCRGRCAIATVKTYEAILGHYVASNAKLSPTSIGRYSLREYIAARNWSVARCHLFVRAVGSMASWARREYGIAWRPTEGVELPPPYRRDLPVASAAQVAGLVATLEAASSPWAVPVALAGLLGLRRGEIARVTHADVIGSPDAPSLVVHGTKTHRDRTLPITPALARMLAGATLPPPVPTGGGSYAQLRATAQAAGCPLLAGHPLHGLRHAAASAWMLRGVPSHLIGRLLGHAPGSPVTARYCHASAEALRAAVGG